MKLTLRRVTQVSFIIALVVGVAMLLLYTVLGAANRLAFEAVVGTISTISAISAIFAVLEAQRTNRIANMQLATAREDVTEQRRARGIERLAQLHEVISTFEPPTTSEHASRARYLLVVALLKAEPYLESTAVVTPVVDALDAMERGQGQSSQTEFRLLAREAAEAVERDIAGLVTDPTIVRLHGRMPAVAEVIAMLNRSR